jgi:hypothetical protein
MEMPERHPFRTSARFSMSLCPFDSKVSNAHYPVGQDGLGPVAQAAF